MCESRDLLIVYLIVMKIKHILHKEAPASSITLGFSLLLIIILLYFCFFYYPSCRLQRQTLTKFMLHNKSPENHIKQYFFTTLIIFFIY